MAKIMDPILPLLSILGYWAIILGSFGGPGLHRPPELRSLLGPMSTHRLPRPLKAFGRQGSGYWGHKAWVLSWMLLVSKPPKGAQQQSGIILLATIEAPTSPGPNHMQQ